MKNIDLEPVSVWRKNLKQRALALFGSKCCICAYDRCSAALEFHHLDPSKKDFSISQAYANPKKWETIVAELEKCILVCSNCHREIHQGILLVENKNYILTDKDYRIVEKTHHRCNCGVVIKLSSKFCSPNCYAKGVATRDWLSEKDNILYLKDVEKLSYVAIANKYNVSDNTIRKWYLKFSNS
jgi:hypothetical protein